MAYKRYTQCTAGRRSNFITGLGDSGRMDVETIIREARADNLCDTLRFQTDAGKQAFKRQVRQFTASTETLQRRQDVIQEMRKHIQTNPEVLNSLLTDFAEIGKLEKQCEVFHERTSVETDSFEQLLFSHYEPLRIFNTIPFLLFIVAMYKQYVVPLMAILMPVFIAIGPYLLIRFWHNMPISMDMYTRIMMDMFGLKSPLDIKQVAQMSMTLFALVQGMYQPIQNAIHLHTIDKDIQTKGHLIEQVGRLYEKIRQAFPENLRLQHPLLQFLNGDTRQEFATIWDHPFLLKYTWSYIGDCEVIFRIATSDWKAVRYVKSKLSEPLVILCGAQDPFLTTGERITFDLRFMSAKNTGQHSLLTGPNRGGKSSTLRTTLLAILLAQTFGVSTFQEKMILQPFDWIATGLRLEDRPGKASMFESEVEFARKIIQRAHKTPEQRGLVLFDELFHSTNPPDGKHTAEVFLQQLWTCPNIASFISTHVFSLVEHAPESVQRLCTYAYRDNQNHLHLTYRLQPGICQESTVDMILREKGLLV
jgi:hypothetical protein